MVEEHEALLAKGTSKKKAAATIKAMRPPKNPNRPNCDVPGHPDEERLTDSGKEVSYSLTHSLTHAFTHSLTHSLSWA